MIPYIITNEEEDDTFFTMICLGTQNKRLALKMMRDYIKKDFDFKLPKLKDLKLVPVWEARDFIYWENQPDKEYKYVGSAWCYNLEF